MRKIWISAAAALALLVPAAAARAEEPARPWSNTAELAAILTSGNSQTRNFALSNKFAYKWTEAELSVLAAALRASNTIRSFENADGTLVTTETTETTAEAYSLDGKYRRNIRAEFFWYAGAGWLKNRPTGIDRRLYGGGGVGYRFLKDDVQTLVGELGADYTDESRVFGGSDSFAGARAFLGYERALSETATISSDLEVLENLDDTEDLRAKWASAVTASLSTRTALKLGFTVLYDRQPVVRTVADTVGPVFGPDLLVPFKKTDTILSASLVVNF